MKRALLASLCALAFVVQGQSVSAANHIQRTTYAPHGCHRFTVRMDERAARAVERGTRRVTRRNLRLLGYLEACQRNPAARWYVRWYNHHQAAQHRARVAEARQRRYEARLMASMGAATASWYEDAGSTASGFHATYGFASLIYPFGTRVMFCYPWPHPARCVTGVDDDHGPYVSGRTFDLNQTLAGALGFDGVGTVGYRRL